MTHEQTCMLLYIAERARVTHAQLSEQQIERRLAARRPLETGAQLAARRRTVRVRALRYLLSEGLITASRSGSMQPDAGQVIYRPTSKATKRIRSACAQAVGHAALGPQR